MKTIIIMAALIPSCIGNIWNGEGPSGQQDPAPHFSYLCVGMEYSQRFGDCPGCELDAKRLSKLIGGEYGYPGETLISESAKKSDVVKKLKEGIERTPEDGMFLFFYSGHGGQEYLGGKEPDGADRYDEFLCLYDTYMLDDEIWDIVSKCKGRVFLYFDACHSATMYRSVAAGTNSVKRTSGAYALAVDADELTWTKGFTFRPERFVKARASSSGGAKASQSPRILCWSGCKEKEFSYGGTSGGTMTTAVMYCWQKGRSYGSMWTGVERLVKAMQEGQNPVQTRVGGGFPEDKEAFR